MRATKEVGLQAQISRRKQRLLLGEGDGSYALALLRKHPEKSIAGTLTVTEFETEEKLSSIFPKFSENRSELAKYDVRFLFNIDARRLHEEARLAQVRYQRIHFNFPYDDRENPLGTTKFSRNLLSEFFKSAAKKQELKDRVHIALPKGANPSRGKWYEIEFYGIFEASAQARYKLIQKRKFDEKRYPGYPRYSCELDPDSEDFSVKYFPATWEAREYIFEKTALLYDEIAAQNLSLEFSDSTDDDSSDYEEEKHFSMHP